jgi:hypothetical protein
MAYIGNIPADKYQTLQKQSFTTSATDTYTLDYAVTNPQDLALFINSVRQNPNDAYTVSNTTLTLSSAITGSDTMYAVFLGRAVETVAPAIGSVTNSMLAGSIATSKLADGSTFATTNGITMADQWRLTTNFSTNDSDVNTNLERVDGGYFNVLGSGMSESSGVFTFPTTGYYLINFQALSLRSGTDTDNVKAKIGVTINNSSYTNESEAFTYHTGGGAGNPYSSTGVAQIIVDVSDTTNVKVKFGVSASATVTFVGSTSNSVTYMTFIRLGDR